MSNEIGTFDLNEFDAAFKELDADLAELASLEEDDAEVSTENLDLMSELEQELSSAGILEEGEEVSGLSGLAESEVEVAFLRRWLRKKALRLIRKLYGYVSRCRGCIGLLRKAIAAFRRGRYVSAIRYAYQTYRCIRRCIRR